MEERRDRGGNRQRPSILGAASGSWVRDLTNVGGTLYFTADDGNSGEEIWKSDGTYLGTVRVKDIVAGPLSSSPEYLINVGGTLYFVANDELSGFELWSSDGTAAGTNRVKDIRPGVGSGFSINPIYLWTEVDDSLYFTANDGASGFELWKSDGTEAGTIRVSDIHVGSDGSYPNYATNVDGVLYFAAWTPSGGTELWKSDGTETGTVLVADLTGDSKSSSPQSVVEVNGRLFVVATTDEYGEELWVADLRPAPIDGDYDDNGIVDGTDLLLWQRQFGDSVAPAGSEADGDGSGSVDGGDLTVWQNHFGESALLAATAASSTSAAVASLAAAEENDSLANDAADADGPVDLASRDALYAAGDFTMLFAEVRSEGWKRRGVRVRG